MSSETLSQRQPYRTTQQTSSAKQPSESSDRNLSSDGKVDLVTNAYSVSISTTFKHTVEKYSIEISLSSDRRNIKPPVLLKNFVCKKLREFIMYELIPDMHNQSSGSSVVISQNLDYLYTREPLRMYDELGNAIRDNEGNLSFSDLYIKTDLLTNLCVNIKFTYIETVSLDDLRNDFSLLDSVLHHKLLLTMLKYESVFYAPRLEDQARNNSRLDLISQHVMGISLSNLRGTVNGDSIVVINFSHSYITIPNTLIDLLATFVRNEPIRGTQLLHSETDPSKIQRHAIREILRISCNEEWFDEFKKILSGFKCRASDGRTSVNLRFSPTKESAFELKMNASNREKETSMTVYDYYKSIGINLNYPNLPCLPTNLGHYYPFELCSILPHQKVPIFRLSSAARNQLNSLNKPKPHAYQRCCQGVRDNFESISVHELNAFGIKLNINPSMAEGSTLGPPSLKYSNLQLVPKRDRWESGIFCQAIHLINNWCIVNTVPIDMKQEDMFFYKFSQYCAKFGLRIGKPIIIFENKLDLLNKENNMRDLIDKCRQLTKNQLRLIMFVIDSSSTPLNRLIHSSFDDHSTLTAACLRVESIMNTNKHGSIYRTLVHKLNTRLGGTNVTYDHETLARLNINCNELMIIGLDVTHPDNELNGVSIVGCAYTYSNDLFKHRSLVWPQKARVEIIEKMDVLMKRLLHEYYQENRRTLPKHIVIYRDGVSNEEFSRVNDIEVSKVQIVIDEFPIETSLIRPKLSFLIAQKRHTMRFFHQSGSQNCMQVSNPPSGTLIDRDVITNLGREFYLFSNTSPQATARPLHYHVLVTGLRFRDLQNLTYYMCFNFGKCSATLSMPSCLKYAHNAAYDARIRVIASREFDEDKFYINKFFC